MGLEALFGESVVTTRIDDLLNWARQNSLMPMPFGTACCAIEFMGLVSSQFDVSRFGAEIVRFSPRQSDLLLVMGTISYKQAPILRRIYDQMPDPKWVLSMGVCASSGGFYDNYCTVQGIDDVIPVDIYVGGCPPRPEGLIEAIVKLQQQRIAKESVVGRPRPVVSLPVADRDREGGALETVRH
ncbi:MAG: NADH-quinone oxidoreductase subunit B [Cyanobacteria bacterium REEB65]|nr:NADH-quinone oxidoreductase subunit B [Cyanobacteria bacterium REEB65]